MYATYKGNEYEVFDVSPGLEELELKARDEYFKEDRVLGFSYTREMDITDKFVSCDEIDGIRVEKRSVKKEFLEKYYNK